MKLTVKGIFPSSEAFYVYVNDEVCELDCDNKSFVFDLPDDGAYSVGIERVRADSNHTLPKILFFIVTSPLQAVFRMFFADRDWFEDAEPYAVYTDMTPVELKGDTAITFSYTKSKYNSAVEGYFKPEITVKDYEFENFYEKDDYGISNCYFSFIKNLASCVLIVCAIMIILAVSSFSKTTAGFIAAIATAVFCVAAGIVAALMHYRKMKKLYNNL